MSGLNPDGLGNTESFSAQESESILGVADHIVGNETELVDALDNLSDGDTVLIDPENPPIETTQWLHIDGVSGVDVVGDGSRTQIKVADGADVGGFIVGESAACTSITFRGVAIDGNRPNQDSSVKDKTAIRLVDVEDATVEDCFIERTGPQEHTTGGSGILIYHNCVNVDIRSCWIDDIGDRGIETAGDDVTIEGLRTTNGYDRGIALEAPEPQGDGTRDFYQARDTTVQNCSIHDNAEGSLIGSGVNEAGVSPSWMILNNRGGGTCRRFVRVTADPGKVVISNNQWSKTADAAGGDSSYDGIEIDEANIGEVIVSGEQMSGVTGNGINIYRAGSAQVRECRIDNPGGHGIRMDGGGVVESCIVIGAGDHGIINRHDTQWTCRDCEVRQSQNIGIWDDSSASRNVVEDCFIANNHQSDSSGSELQVGSTECVLRDNKIVPTDSALFVGGSAFQDGNIAWDSTNTTWTTV